MSFLSRLFRKRPPAQLPAPEKNDEPAPVRSAPDKLTELRRQAGTGDPVLKGKHRSGNF